MRKRRHALAAVLSLALVAGIPAPAHAKTLPTSEVRKLPTATHYKEQIASSNKLVVWGDFRRGEQDRDLYGYDLTAKREVFIAGGAGQQRWPSVDGDRVVWWDADWRRSTGSDIHMLDYATKRKTVVCDDPGDQSTPEVDGDIVVWTDTVYLPATMQWESDVKGVHLSTGAQFVVASGPKSQAQPDVAGDWVVYADYAADKGGDIKAFNLVSKERITIASGSREQTMPRIGEDLNVVWQEDGGSSKTDIRGFSLKSRDHFNVSTASGNQHNASVSSGLVVYEDDRNPDGYVVIGYDLLSGARFGIAAKGGVIHYVSSLSDGVLTWIKSTDQESKSTVYQARPTELAVLSSPDTTYDTPAGSAMAAGLNAAATGGTVVVAGNASWHYPLIAQSVMAASTPVVLTTPGSLSSVAAAQLRRARPSKVIIVGGGGSVSQTTRSQIESIVGTRAVTRIDGSGARSTALAVVAARARRGGWNGTVVVVSSTKWAGAMTASSVVSARSYPLVLVGKTGLTKTELSRLKSAGMKRAIVVGDTKSVSSKTSKQLQRALGKKKVVRIAGKNRYDTSVQFASWAVKKESMRWNRLGIVSGDDYRQALLAGVVKGRTKSVVLLTGKKSLSSSTANGLKRVQSKVRAADFMGSTKTISKKTRKQTRMVVR